MDVSLLLARAARTPEPVFSGEWATLWFRPDLGSQQEFVIGIAATIEGDSRPHIRWLPNYTKLSGLYGDALSGAEIRSLASGVEVSLENNFRGGIRGLATGTPHLRLVNCGHLSTNNIDRELSQLLKRHAGALWAEPVSRESAMDEGWAYAEMRRALTTVAHSVFVPARQITLGSKTIHVGLDNGRSYGNIVSARYSSMQTIERHVFQSMTNVLAAHNLDSRKAEPALFVVLPLSAEGPVEALNAKKTEQLLEAVVDAGVMAFCESQPGALAEKLEKWAAP